jgi:hypothetical protein
MTVYGEGRMKPINTLYGQNAEVMNVGSRWYVYIPLVIASYEL